MAHLDVRDQRIEVQHIAGSGATTLVFLHEGLGCASGWRDFPAQLAAATGCPGLIYSRLGYGRSAPAPLPRPLRFLHHEALVVLPALLDRAGIDDAILIGHSDGASIALIYAGTIGDRIRGLVVEAPHVFVEDVCIASIAAFRAAYPGSEARDKLLRRHDDADTMVRGWTDVWLDPEFRLFNIQDVLSGVRVPSLVIQGEADEYGTIAQVDAVCAGVSGRAKRLLLPNVGHAPHRDEPEVVLEAMTRFVLHQIRPAADSRFSAGKSSS